MMKTKKLISFILLRLRTTGYGRPRHSQGIGITIFAILFFVCFSFQAKAETREYYKYIYTNLFAGQEYNYGSYYTYSETTHPVVGGVPYIKTKNINYRESGQKPDDLIIRNETLSGIISQFNVNRDYNFYIQIEDKTKWVYVGDQNIMPFKEKLYYYDFFNIRIDDYADDFTDTNHVGILSFLTPLAGSILPEKTWPENPKTDTGGYISPQHDIPADVDCFKIGTSGHGGNPFMLIVKSIDDKELNAIVEIGNDTNTYIGAKIEVEITNAASEIVYITVSADNPEDRISYRIRPYIPQSKSFFRFKQAGPVQWVNYSNPKSKGDDADNGAQPSFHPVCGVDNVSLMPGVRMSPFNINIPYGSVNFTPVLSYSPPTLSRSVSISYLNGYEYKNVSYNISAPASSFGHCWSDNLTPKIEDTRIKTTIGYDEMWEYSTSFNNAPTPGCSFDGGYNIDEDDPVTWIAEPFTKANYDDTSLTYWQSGINVYDFNPDNNVYPITVEKEDDLNNVIKVTNYKWPEFIKDRNNNLIKFKYNSSLETVKTSSSISGGESSNFNDYDSASTKLHIINKVSLDLDSGNELSLNITETVGKVTQMTLTNGSDEIRAPVKFTYKNIKIAEESNTVNDLYIDLLTSMTLADGNTITCIYNNVLVTTTIDDLLFPEDSEFEIVNLPYLDKIISPGNTTVFEYTFNNSFDNRFYGPEEVKKYEPEKVTIIHNGVTTQIFAKSSCDYSDEYGTVTMQTITPASTTNEKLYSVYFNKASMQWFGVQAENTLDARLQNNYFFSFTRLLYTDIYSFPNADDDPDNNAIKYNSNFSYDGYDNLTSASDGEGNTVQYSYENGMDLVEEISPRGILTSNYYDSAGNLLKTLEGVGDFEVEHYSNGIPVSSTFEWSEGRESTFEYNIAGQLVKSTDPIGRESFNFYKIDGEPDNPGNYSGSPDTNQIGYLVASRDPIGRVTTFEYDKLGRQIEVNAPGDPGFNSGRYIINNVYDKLDRLVATHFPDGTSVSNVFNYAGYPINVKDRKGRWTTSTFDAAGHLTRVEFPNGDFIEKTYKGNLVSKLVDGEGNVTKFFYDHEQLIGVEFPDGTKRSAGFDNLNNQIWAVDERGVAVTNVYDKANRLLLSKYLPRSAISDFGVFPCVTKLPSSIPGFSANDVYGSIDQSISYEYDAAGNIIKLSDWTGTNSYIYDQYNRPIIQTIKKIPLNKGGQGVVDDVSNFLYQIENSFDIVDNRTNFSINILRNWTTNDSLETMLNTTDDDQVRSNVFEQSYEYDNLNRLTATHSPFPKGGEGDFISATYTYNQNNKLNTYTPNYSGDELTTVNYSYDSEQRLKSIIAGSLLDLQYTYNTAQQITQILETASTFGTRTSGYTYDNRDQLTVSRTSQCGTNAYFYDKARNRTRQISNFEFPITNVYSYVLANKLKSMAEGDTSQTDADNDGLTRDDEITYGSDPNNADTDNDGLNDSAEIALNTCPWKIDSDGDGVPDNTDIEPLKPNNCVWFGATDTVWPTLWWIDSPSKPNYGSTSNKYNYVYDSAGNLKTKTENGNILTKYYYNARNKLCRIEGDGFLYEFLYDSQNRRVAIGTGQNDSSLIWRKIIHDGNLPIIETDCTNIIEKIFVRGLGIAEGTGDIIAELTADGSLLTAYYVCNHRGDTVLILDSYGDIENYFCYDAFGNVVEKTGTFEPRFTFSSKEFLSNAELYLYAYRVYDPVSGRWTQRDPIDYQDSINLYQFCGNNPINKFDVDGRKDGGNYFTHCDPDYAYNWNDTDRINTEVAFDGAPLYTKEAAATMLASGFVIIAAPTIISASSAIAVSVYTGLETATLATVYFGGGMLVGAPEVVNHAPQFYINLNQIANSPAGFLIMDSFNPSKPPIVEEILKDAWDEIENIGEDK